jgi:hypothetical protein
MNIYRRMSTILVILSLITAPSLALADAPPLNGQVYSIKKDEKAPYAGVLLDNIAAAKMVTNEKYLRSEIELKLRKEFQEELADKSLNLNLIKAEFDSFKELNQSILLIRETEIEQLNSALKEEIVDYTHWWYAGGVVTGILLSIGIFYVATEIRN